MKGRVLVVDDEKNMGLVIQATLERAGFEVLYFHDSREAMEAVESDDLDAIVTDLHMPGFGGMEVLAHARTHRPQVPVVMITAFGTVESAVSALKSGAFDFITKPFDQSELLAVIEKACRTHQARLSEPNAGGGAETRGPFSTGVSAARETSEFPGDSTSVAELRRVIEKVAATDSTVLIGGESGTGKELLALEIHRLSKRAEKSLIKVNCAVIPTGLIESELFGVERGAYTGAAASKPGRFELADEGTLFLDEVGEIPLEMQAKLLRAIGPVPGEQEFERVGGLATIRVNVRIIAATNRDLVAEVKAGRFREDLFYRLNIVPVELPPLRDRCEDIEPLVRRFLGVFNARFEKKVARIEPELLTALKDYCWPGNIRQLENAMERMVLLSDSDSLGVGALPEEIASEVFSATGGKAPGLDPTIGFKEKIRRQTQAMERGLIEEALAETDGNVTRTAEKLGLSRKGLQLKMKELGIRRG
jgi:DNA-binding NtrC family response regulator